MYDSCYPYGEYALMHAIKAPNQGSTFVLIIVLFILLIIVGRSYV
ncbi:YjcZ family sporulation protein [Paenisporosarcina indica]|nr:YjcZ family sporulation protein [Paenisporosarcina indica]